MIDIDLSVAFFAGDSSRKTFIEKSSFRSEKKQWDAKGLRGSEYQNQLVNEQKGFSSSAKNSLFWAINTKDK